MVISGVSRNDCIIVVESCGDIFRPFPGFEAKEIF
jgi:hypothetical protein